jgi:hypothetical protein
MLLPVLEIPPEISQYLVSRVTADRPDLPIVQRRRRSKDVSKPRYPKCFAPRPARSKSCVLTTTNPRQAQVNGAD